MSLVSLDLTCGACIETGETREAGGQFRKRKAQERVDEQGDGDFGEDGSP
jgi:hypothetical protein